MTNLDLIQALEKAVQASPDNLALRRHLADLMLAEGLFAEAVDQYRQALDLAHSDDGIKLGLARAYAGQGKEDVALVVLEDVMRTGTPSAEALVMAARLYLKTNQKNDAARTYERARTLPGFQTDPEIEAWFRHPASKPPVIEEQPTGSNGQKTHEIVIQLPARLTGDGVPSKEEAASDETEHTSEERERVPTFLNQADEDGSGLFEIERPHITFSDVGGMEKLKEEIRMKIIYPLSHPELFRAYGKTAGGGILMYGPPGCGKTFLARATAGEVKANFLSIGLHDVLDMYIGQSERNLHKVFETARRMAPCVLFFDEVDALGANRSDMRHNAMRQVINQMLAEMDGVESSNEGVLILAATNAPWYVDHALRRPGRFDRVLFVPPPDQPAREIILRLMLQGRPTGTVDLTRLARETKDFSGADIKGAIDQAVERKLADAMRRGKPYPITTIDLSDAIRRQRPTTLEWFETARNYAIYANEGGIYDDVLDYLKLPRARKG